MRLHSAFPSIIVAASCLASDARAEGFVATSQTKVEMTAEGGYYDDRTFPIEPTGPTALRARIVLSDVDTHPKWLPMAGFVVKNGETSISFRIVRRIRENRSRLEAELVRWNDKKETHAKEYRYVVLVGEPTELTMAWTRAGTVSASWVGRGKPEQQTLELGNEPKEIGIAVSGGRLVVDPLEFGHMEPSAPVTLPPTK